MKRLEAALFVGVVFSILLSSFGSFGKQCEEIQDGVLRLHILANSDSEEDQRLKLQVRDAILARSEELFRNAASKSEAEEAAAFHLDAIEAAALEEIRRQGCDAPVSVRLVNRFFDTRVYEDFTMPAGRYDAVQVEIGSGGGRNWWCVMFPPMCLPAAMEQPSLPLEEQILDLGEPPRYKPAFAVVELVEELRETLRPRAPESLEETSPDSSKKDRTA